ncbi:MAG: pilus assembly protein TadG-related protein [Methylovirgula sp.]|jgi:Flp pilus assembly protein TadG
MLFRKLRRLTSDFRRDRRANVVMIFAFLLIPVLFAAGMGVDYATAARRRAKLDAAADSAALAAVTPSSMALSSTNAQTLAQTLFNTLSSQVMGIQSASLKPTITVTDNGLNRTATVSYTANSLTSFSGIIGKTTLTIGGKSTASASLPPNIDFYLLLDDSPSMAIAATTTGINTMVANTTSQGGCAFGCHEYNPSADGLGNPGNEDNYQLARNLGVTLRIDLVGTAAQNLMTQAQSTETTTNATYRMALYSFDYAFNSLQSLTSNLTTAKTAASNIQILEVYQQNWLTQSQMQKNQSTAVGANDTDTDFSDAMNSINGIMPNPGGGTQAKGDSPQEVLFLVTDGVEDAMVSGSRVQALMDTSWCTTVKNRGIRIAVLYTQYLPLPTDTWYNTYISPFQSQISGNMQGCASPGLFTAVTTDGDISAALVSLFNTAVMTASHLTQ